MEFDKIYTSKIHWNQMSNSNTYINNHSLIAKIMEVGQYKGIISFAGGIPASDTYPIEILREIQNECMNKYKEQLFMPTSTYGYIELRKSIKRHIEKRGVNASIKEIMITSGSQQGLYYFAKLFVEPGDVVLVEEPTYLGAIEIFKSAKAKVIGVPIDEEGIRTDIIESMLLKYRPKFLYVQPSFQNPSGVTLSLKRRKELLKLAYFYQIPILEDDSYSEINFSGNKLPSLKALDKNDYVVYLGTFSKVLSLGMRIGWVNANEYIIDRFGGFKQMTDLQSNTMAQYILSEFLNGDYYDKHVDGIIHEYKIKRDLMCSEILKYKIDGLKLTIPEGGFFLWCKLPENIRLNTLMDNAMKESILFMPSDPFYPNGSVGDINIRLNYTYPTNEEVIEGVRRLIEAIRKSQITTYTSKKSTYNRSPIL
jgi:DNA-binding transcriptional MocR family regulator